MRKLNLIKPKIIGLDELKINIVKIWSDSLINEEYDVNDEIISNLIFDISEIMRSTNERFIIVSSWAIAKWKAYYKSIDIDYNCYSLAELAAKGQPRLYSRWEDAFYKHKIITNQCLIWEKINHEHIQTELLNTLRKWNVPIVNFNDWASDQELKEYIEHSDNDKTVTALINSFNWKIHSLINEVVYLTNTRGVENRKKWIIMPWKIWLSTDNTEELKRIFDELKLCVESDISWKWTWWMMPKIEEVEAIVYNWINAHIASAKDWLRTLHEDWISTKFIFKIAESYIQSIS